MRARFRLAGRHRPRRRSRTRDSLRPKQLGLLAGNSGVDNVNAEILRRKRLAISDSRMRSSDSKRPHGRLPIVEIDDDVCSMDWIGGDMIAFMRRLPVGASPASIEKALQDRLRPARHRGPCGNDPPAKASASPPYCGSRLFPYRLANRLFAATPPARRWSMKPRKQRSRRCKLRTIFRWRIPLSRPPEGQRAA